MESSFAQNQVLSRYAESGYNLLYSYTELKNLNIDIDFIHALIQAFEDEKAFSEDIFSKFSLQTILDYIHRTHQYYLTKKLCEIEQSIDILLKDYSNNHPLLHILNNFFNDYREGLTAHIHAEEAELIPYIKILLQVENNNAASEKFLNAISKFSVQTFIDHHQDTEKDISNVQQAILQYHPPVTNQTPYRILLSQLQTFEHDLAIHALIEDHVLIPRVLRLEKKLHEIYKSESFRN